jgi:hypothetical protein
MGEMKARFQLSVHQVRSIQESRNWVFKNPIFFSVYYRH